MQWDSEVAELVRKYNKGTISDEELEDLEDLGYFDDDSEMYPHDEHVGLNPPWWEAR